ncbi:uncharacterized protein BYT42DRAFT_550640 [Radiomyces spectabilis]|uniref:uncharacterized protein n=1 Tax=Radiomyces spectabilis TaxID=64574 RepID=UPI00221EDE19|nr:uncharacterized protein BYT42DRAFT_550640 [Radiomyces spectabilis]KAI8393319.1 hypothetical protein BYT42DRAFT_550640 [Radiomyces spectabilis]
MLASFFVPEYYLAGWTLHEQFNLFDHFSISLVDLMLVCKDMCRLFHPTTKCPCSSVPAWHLIMMIDNMFSMQFSIFVRYRQTALIGYPLAFA